MHIEYLSDFELNYYVMKAHYTDGRKIDISFNVVRVETQPGSEIYFTPVWDQHLFFLIKNERIDVISDPNGADVWMARQYVNKKEYKQYNKSLEKAVKLCYISYKLGTELSPVGRE